ncbi:MAG: hypothetical protein WC788_05385 [Candidatus Paceibacterota bacterium]
MTHVINLIVWADMGLVTGINWKIDAIECKSQFYREKYQNEMEKLEFEKECEITDFFGEDGWILSTVTDIPVVRGKRNKYYFHHFDR